MVGSLGSQAHKPWLKRKKLSHYLYSQTVLPFKGYPPLSLNEFQPKLGVPKKPHGVMAVEKLLFNTRFLAVECGIV